MTRRWTGEQAPPATATPSEAETISCGNPFDWKSRGLRPSRALLGSAEGTDSPPHLPFVAMRMRFPAEIPLIGNSRGLRPSRALPEAEGTESPPHHPFSDSAEILRISGRGICKEAIFSPGGKLPSEKISAIPPRMSPGSIGSREGSHPLELSGGCPIEKFRSRRSEGLFW